MRIASAGHALFAAILIALGLQGIVRGDFTAVWAPVPKGVPLRHALATVCALVSLGSGVGLLGRRSAATASRVLFLSLALWMLVFRVPPIVRAPLTLLPWDGCAETAAMVAGAWVLYARLASGPAAGREGARLARGLYGLALIPFGLAHFAFVKETASLVPAWVPAHVAVAYLTGAAFLAASAGVLSGIRARLAATLSALQIGLFTLLVWVPVIAAGSKDAFAWSEFAISSALTAAAWVVAESLGRA